MNTGSACAEGRKRRQAGSAARRCAKALRLRSARSGVVSHRPEQLCARLRAHRRGWLRVSDSAWLLEEKTLPLPHPKRIGSPWPLTIRCWCLCMATLKLPLILVERYRPRHGEPGAHTGSAWTAYGSQAGRMSRKGVDEGHIPTLLKA